MRRGSLDLAPPGEYDLTMTKLLAKALDAIRQLSPEEQDDIARTILALVGSADGDPVPLTADERAAIARSKAEAARGEFASDEEVRAVWAKYGL
jgi:predicted transcriptional regulator